jgi:hypothetical protein
MFRAPGAALLSLLSLAACSRESVPSSGEPTATSTSSSPFPAQPGWVAETPTSSMRVAQFRLPGRDGARDAEFAVFAFAGGGTVESNLDRWCAQFEQPGGGDSREAATTEVTRRDDLTVHRVEVSGTYVAETTPGSGQRLNEPGWKLVGAVIEGPSGLHFVKCTGPAETVDFWRDSVDAFLGSVRP